MGHQSNAVGGRLKPFLDNWAQLTSDPYILEAVSGYKLEFDPEKFPPKREKPLYNYKRNSTETAKICQEIQNLEQKNVIERCTHENGEFISTIFTRMKKNGGTRIILDLSELNKSIVYHHFKMDSISSAITLLNAGDHMASVDLQDAYYSVPIHSQYRKYLRFEWGDELWQFKSLPNGLSSAPRLFTKLLKPALAHLRQAGHTVLAYLDDTIIVGKTVQDTERAVKATTNLLSNLGFLIHPEKSCLEPSQKIEFLGFNLNTTEMTVTLPNKKVEEIKEVCSQLLACNRPSIREVARVIGKLIAALPASQYGPLHYRNLETEKIKALKLNRGHFDRPMVLSEKAKADLVWWIEHVPSAYKPIIRERPKIEICTDASGDGWGATEGNSRTGGRWNSQELALAKRNEINYLEMLAALFGLKAYCSQIRDAHILVRMDNTTAVAYVNNMGGTKSPQCNKMAQQIWEWCSDRSIWITASYLPGSQNVDADFMSRKFNDNIEWMLNRDIFSEIVQRFGKPDIDLFASRINTQLPVYVSWKPDPSAWAIDAFSLDWGNLNFYAFPPFNLISKCLQKIRSDRAQGLLVVPNWPTQPWFPILHDLLLEEPFVLPNIEFLLTQPVSGTAHPLTKPNLLCCRLGVDTTLNKD